MGKAINQIQTKMEEFIERCDNKVISFHISSVKKFIKTYDLDINEFTTRESLYWNNHYVFATILKNKSAFKHSLAIGFPYDDNIIVII